MPADRLFHKRLGHSVKVSALTDIEYRVWSQYQLSADDFGVMRESAVTLQADNDNLAARPAALILKALKRLVEIGLLRRFIHQVHSYVCQHDWQDFQRVTWPAKTFNPPAPPELLETFSETTQQLFSVHPGAKKVPPKNSESTSEVLHENSEGTSEKLSSSRAGAPAKRLTANTNGSPITANGSPIVAKRRLDAFFEYGRLYVPGRAHADLLAIRGNERELLAFYEEICETWTNGAHALDNPGTDMIRFWKAQSDLKWPPTIEAKPRANEPQWARDIKARQAQS